MTTMSDENQGYQCSRCGGIGGECELCSGTGYLGGDSLEVDPQADGSIRVTGSRLWVYEVDPGVVLISTTRLEGATFQRLGETYVYPLTDMRKGND